MQNKKVSSFQGCFNSGPYKSVLKPPHFKVIKSECLHFKGALIEIRSLQKCLEASSFQGY